MPSAASVKSRLNSEYYFRLTPVCSAPPTASLAQIRSLKGAGVQKTKGERKVVTSLRSSAGALKGGKGSNLKRQGSLDTANANASPQLQHNASTSTSSSVRQQSQTHVKQEPAVAAPTERKAVAKMATITIDGLVYPMPVIACDTMSTFPLCQAQVQRSAEERLFGKLEEE